MPTDLLNYLERERDQAKKAARDILDAAENDGRELTTDEQVEVDTHISSAKDYVQKIAKEKDAREKRKAVDDLIDVGDPDDGQSPQAKAMGIAPVGSRVPKTIGEAFVTSTLYKSIVAAYKAGGKSLGEHFRTPAVEMPHVDVKAAANPVLESANTAITGSGGAAFAETRLLQVEAPSFLRLRLTIADVIRSIPVTDGNTVTYPIVKDRTKMESAAMTGTAGFTAEGAAKTSVGYEFDTVFAQLKKIAGYTKLSTELAEDAPFIRSFIDADMPLQIRYAEEKYLAVVLWAGVVDATALTGATTNFDDILAAKNTVMLNGGNPDAMIIHPTDWSNLLVAKFGTGAGDKQYVGGGPFTTVDNPWDLRVVVSPFATLSHPLIGDFSMGARVFRKGGVSVDVTNTDQDDFIKNMITVRAEERLVAAKIYPELFKTADLT